MVVISMMVFCKASDTIEYDRRRSELSSAPLHMKKDLEQHKQSNSDSNSNSNLDLNMINPLLSRTPKMFHVDYIRTLEMFHSLLFSLVLFICLYMYVYMLYVKRG